MVPCCLGPALLEPFPPPSQLLPCSCGRDSWLVSSLTAALVVVVILLHPLVSISTTGIQLRPATLLLGTLVLLLLLLL